MQLLVSKAVLSALCFATAITASIHPRIGPENGVARRGEITHPGGKDLVRRDAIDNNVLTNGGWGLAINSTAGCPNGNSVAGAGYCCPTVLEEAPETTGAGAHACCPTGSDCLASIQATPYCARLTWVLWSSTTVAKEDGYFCCQGGHVGTNDLTCVLNDKTTIKDNGGRAERLGRPLPPGIGSSATSGASASTSTSTATSASVLAASLTASGTKSAATGGATGRPMMAGGAVGFLAGIVAAAAL